LVDIFANALFRYPRSLVTTEPINTTNNNGVDALASAVERQLDLNEKTGLVRQ
jgi:hypothetical protein